MVAAPAFASESSSRDVLAFEAHPDFVDVAAPEVTAIEGIGGLRSSAPSADAAPVEAVASAERAVEVVLRAVDRVETREQQSVNLRFSVGGDDLDVRVEMHANEVRAIFRTESPELRAALSHEWNALQGQATSPRAVTPVFTASDANAFAQSHGEGAAQQRDAHARRTREPSAIAGVNRARRPGGADFSSAAAVSTSSARPHSGTSLHLHTLA